MKTEAELKKILKKLRTDQKDDMILFLAGWFSLAKPFKYVPNSRWQVNPKIAFEKAFQGALDFVKKLKK